VAGKALLIRVGALGDTIHASSAALLLKKQNPGMQVDFVAAAGLEGLFDLLPLVDGVLSFPYRRLPLAIHAAWRRIRRNSEREPYQLAFLMETDPRFLPLLQGVRAERRIALTEAERPGQGSREGGVRDCPVPLRYQRALWSCGVAAGVVCPPRLVTRPAHREAAGELLRTLGLDGEAPVIGLHAGNSFRARKRWRRWVRTADLRSWPEENWVELVCRLHRLERRVQFVFFGSRLDRSANARILRGIRGRENRAPVFDAAGRMDIPVAAAVLEQFSLFVSTDTGPIHMAAALGVPLLGLYGPTRYAQTRPFPDGSVAAVLRKSLACQPCYGTEQQKRCGDNLCMRSIGVDEVLARVIELRDGVRGFRDVALASVVEERR
jgi:ADP-heptose:LPS heptosyltransferase